MMELDGYTVDYCEAVTGESIQQHFGQEIESKIIQSSIAVCQIIFKGGLSTRNFEGSIDVDLPAPSQVYHLFCQVRWPAFSSF